MRVLCASLLALTLLTGLSAQPAGKDKSAVRFGIDALDARIFNRTPAAARTILIGAARECADLVSRPAFAPRGDHLVLGVVDTAATPSARALGGLSDLPTLIQEHGVETDGLGVLPGRVRETAGTPAVRGARRPVRP